MTRPVLRQVHTIGKRRAWAIWVVGLSVYVLAVFHRTSLGVAGLLAAERFDISAAQLSTFTVVQLAVYAAMQIPVGVLLDRFGSKKLMLTGLLLMSGGQLWFAVAGSFEVGVAARVMLGAGDAMVFTSLLRLVAVWFRVKQAPFVTQLTGMIGQLGAVAAATPLAAALATFGWTRSFATAGGVGLLLSVGLLAVVKDSPYRGEAVEKIKVRALAKTLAEVWGNPGTRLGLWVHFSSQFGATVFTMLWGFPFLVAEGMTQQAASLVLVAMTVTAMAAGPVVAAFTARMPYRRSQLVLGIVGVIATTWAVVLLWPGPAPTWLLYVLAVVTAFGGPGSMVGFDLARTFHPSSRLGRATGVVNIGGFTASLLAIALIGVVLDHLAPGGPEDYTLDDFRIAMSVQFLFWGLGAVQLVRYRRRSLRHIEEVNPVALDRLREGETLLPGISRDLDG
ncbi:MFS transporter [Phycicoccus sp. MAQZ13P-2]|uniref:MFS transporter n=1 Tax=Phycicoccus mangrovi TaxID=2840470 RepID=UPI001C0009BC|nr:MFS transporter [Phycicoccus mangrovi]MBT9255024.1 MFS transporter [Phycicoccus mangrovi]MBT9255979.1 MFS transporter [Phycicoccus mangrovi]MBT9274008.1 MFS transporter [Phycicoccus mangrovi]